MATPERKGEAELTLAGQLFTLKFGIGALIIAQEHLRARDPLGRTPSIQEIQQELQHGRLLYLRAMVYAALQKHHPEYTLDRVDDLLESVSEPEAQTMIAAFGFAVTPDPADVQDLEVKSNGNPRKAQTTTRRRSGGGSTTRHVA